MPPLRAAGLLVQILDIVLVEKQVGGSRASDANEIHVEELHQTLYFLVIAEPDADGNLLIDEIAQVGDFLKRLLGRSSLRFRSLRCHVILDFTAADMFFRWAGQNLH